jgi:hypothetical protein
MPNVSVVMKPGVKTWKTAAAAWNQQEIRREL